jgi:hypothetical protein
MTEEEEIVFLLEFRRLQQAKFAQPMAQALATALGRPVDYQIMGNVIIPDDTVPPWTRDSADLQIQKAVILQNLHERYTTVAVQENLRALMDDLRECFGSERELTRELRKDVRRRRKKWPNGVPTASASHFLPLYVSLLGIWKTSQKTVFSKSEILSIGTEGGHIVSQPGTALRRKQRVVIRNDHSPMDFNRLKAKAEGKMADRCMDTLEALGLVKPWPNMKAKLRRPGKPERRWRLWRPNLQFCRTAKNSTNPL